MNVNTNAPSPWAAASATIVLFTAAACVSQTDLYRPPGAAEGPPPPAHFVDSAPSQCVPYARTRSGIAISGDASEWWRLAGETGYARTNQPVPGAVMVLQVDGAGARGHLAYVHRVISPREIVVDHANWHGRGEVAVNVQVVDVSPGNDWSQVRVEWVETGQMGARIYPVLGFVLPARGLGA